MIDYALSRIMKSFDGKSKSLQYKIAQDINAKKNDEDNNIFDMIQGYCADVASVGDSRLAANFVEEDATTAQTTGCALLQEEEPHHR